MATRNFMTQVATEAVWRKMIGPREMYFPTKQTWVGLAMTPPEDRAKVFYQMWRTKPTKEEKQKMFNMAAAIDSVAGRGTIISDRFMIEFNKRRAKFGDDPPLLLGGD